MPVIHCEIHWYKKKGYCLSCKICRCCKPADHCNSISNHHTWLTEEKKRHKNDAKKRSFDELSEDSDMETPNIEHISTQASNGDRLSIVLRCLGNYSNTINLVPQNGYKIDSVDIINKNREYYTANQ